MTARTRRLAPGLVAALAASLVAARGWSGETLEQIVSREADPGGVAPEKVATASPLLQTMAAYGAWGVREMAILMCMDAGLPLGTGHDKRSPEKLREDIRRVTEAMRPYPAFRGWSWSSNWWVYGKRGSAAADSPEEKAAYEAALKHARETGAWDPILDKVSDRRLSMAVRAQEMFNKELNAAAPGAGYVTAVAGPYRNVESYPPVTYANVDEVDLHIQWEQVGVPFHCPHNVDFCRRPGKRGWGHPEDDIKSSMIHRNNGLSFQFDGAYSGGRCFALRGDRKADPLWQPPFGHVIPNWDFEIVEHPRPGQYRWLRFAWKAASAGTKGISLKLSGPRGGVVLSAGEATRFSEVDPAPVKLADSPPRGGSSSADWKVERVDLWEIARKPLRIQALSLGATGGGALFDRILLGGSLPDLGR